MVLAPLGDQETVILVSDTVYRFLKEMQPSKVFTLWWIDAICINQNDVDEKSKQVSRMGMLYKKASLVVVWIPPPSNDPHDVDDALITIAQVVGLSQKHHKLGHCSVKVIDKLWD
jgi:hypothetical protein